MKYVKCSAAVVAMCAGAAFAQLDGMNIGAGMTLLGVQDTPTGFGNATGGGQDSAGGGELDSMWASLGGGTLNVSIAGNIEGNFNKMLIFLDTKAGGENTLLGDNVMGGFNEINNMAGMTFDAGFSPDYAVQFEIGAGFFSVRMADLQGNTGGDIWTGGGPGDLPMVNAAGGFGVTFGWDNSNVLGVDGASAAGALTATTGFELSFDTLTSFGDGALSTVGMMAIYGNSGLDFMSNQVLGDAGLGGAGNLGNVSQFDFGSVAGNQFSVIPAPASMALLGIGGLAAIRRRR